MEVGKVIKRGEDLLKTTEICFGSTKMGIFYREKSLSRRYKNQERITLPLREKYACYAPARR